MSLYAAKYPTEVGRCYSTQQNTQSELEASLYATATQFELVSEALCLKKGEQSDTNWSSPRTALHSELSALYSFMKESPTNGRYRPIRFDATNRLTPSTNNKRVAVQIGHVVFHLFPLCLFFKDSY